MKICPNCETEHEKPGTFCSQTCANSRGPRNDAFKDAVREKAKLRPKIEKIKKACLVCNDEVLYFPSTVKKHPFCTKICKKAYLEAGGSLVSEEHRATLRKHAKNNPLLGGNRNNSAYGYYTSPTAGKVWLESSYEHKVAVELDTNNIAWTRPKPLMYGKKRYYPDFYLTEYDVYLDPKNEYLIEQDRKKIQAVRNENQVTVIVLTKKQLLWTDIQLALEAFIR